MEKYFDFLKMDIFGKKKCPKSKSLDILCKKHSFTAYFKIKVRLQKK
jgi:hypothetical protein